MNLLADESVERQVVARLRQEGHDVLYVAELSPSIPDEEVLNQANSRSALLATADKDFGELVHRQGRVHAGVVLVRLAGLPAAAKAETVARVLWEHASELLGAFSVISPGAVRIRRPDVAEGPPSADISPAPEGVESPSVQKDGSEEPKQATPEDNDGG
jgi:predicted nuclease of predicted toxin-antitoxin system